MTWNKGSSQVFSLKCFQYCSFDENGTIDVGKELDDYKTVLNEYERELHVVCGFINTEKFN